MKKQFRIPVVSCSDSSCEGYQHLYVKTKGIKLSKLKLICQECGHEENIHEKSNEKYTQSMKKVKKSTKELSKTIVQLRSTLPKNMDEWGDIVKNRKTPIYCRFIIGSCYSNTGIIWIWYIYGINVDTW